MVAEHECPRCGNVLPTADARCPVCATSAGGQIVFAGKYRIERLIGKGGQGTVHLAVDLSLDRRCAIKVLRPGLITRADLVARFRKEGRMLARLEHPNVVPVYAIGREGDLPFIVMKYLEGAPLGQLERERFEPWTAAEFTPLLKQVCSGLGHMHAHGFVHRDLKPGNIFVSSEGHATILDLGIARDSDSTLTMPGSAMGTARYMSPEHTGAGPVDPRGDIYSLGVIVFEALTGKLPFDGADVELMRAHRYSPPPDASKLAPVAPEIARLIQRAMAKRPEDRFATAGDFFQEWERTLAGDGGPEPVTDERTAPGRVPVPGWAAVSAPATSAPVPSRSVTPPPALVKLALGAEDPVSATTKVPTPLNPFPGSSEENGDEVTTGSVNPTLVAAVKGPPRPKAEIPVLFPVQAVQSGQPVPPPASSPVPGPWTVLREPAVAPSNVAQVTREVPKKVEAPASPARRARIRPGPILWVIGPLVLGLAALLASANIDLESLRDRLWSSGVRRSARAPKAEGTPAAAAPSATELDAGQLANDAAGH